MAKPEGQILDPDNGKVDRSKVHLTDNGMGVPMLGRSQAGKKP